MEGIMAIVWGMGLHIFNSVQEIRLDKSRIIQK